MPTKQVIVVLGSPNNAQGELMSVARERCALAVQVYQARPQARFLLTGGFGAHFNTTDLPHAHYLRRHLMSLGVPEDAFLPFALSRNTIEDATLSYPIIRAYGARRAIVVTSDYHEARARYVFEQVYHDIDLEWAICVTDERACEFDLAAQRAHEQDALARLKENGLPIL